MIFQRSCLTLITRILVLGHDDEDGWMDGNHFNATLVKLEGNGRCTRSHHAAGNPRVG